MTGGVAEVAFVAGATDVEIVVAVCRADRKCSPDSLDLDLDLDLDLGLGLGLGLDHELEPALDLSPAGDPQKTGPTFVC